MVPQSGSTDALRAEEPPMKRIVLANVVAFGSLAIITAGCKKEEAPAAVSGGVAESPTAQGG